MKLIHIIIFCFVCLNSGYAQRSKMSPLVREAAMASTSSSGTAMAKGARPAEGPCLTAFVESSDVSVLRNHGCHILAQWDDIYIASIPLTEIDALAAERQVSRIEAGRSCSATNDTTASCTHVIDLWQNPTRSGGFTGKDVVVGVMDIGFDLTNPTLYSSDGETYRVKRMWDMLDFTEGGDPVTGSPIDGGYFMGRQYIGYDSLMSKQHSSDGLIQNHGSHTVGTAAGSGARFLCNEGEAVYSGMAPDADICLVSNKVSADNALIPDDDYYKYTSATDMLGFKYIFDYADSVGKPCVISFSEGSYEDLYQSGIYNKVISKMVGPGHILCASAGNEGYKGTYMHKEQGDSLKGAFLKSSSTVALYVLRSQQPPAISLRFYNTGDSSYTEWNYDTEGLKDYPDSLFLDSIIVDGMEYDVLLNMYKSCYDSTLYATDMYVLDMQGMKIGNNPIAMVLAGRDNDVEVFANGGYFVRNSADTSLADFNNEHSVLFPGCLDDVICVGNVQRRSSYVNVWGQTIANGSSTGRIAYDSSHGPSMNGNLKPDVVAPGTQIISSFNSFYPLSKLPNYCVTTKEYKGRTYMYAAKTGTSMSTPVVAGIVALWLQACPTLSPDDIRDVIAHTASHFEEPMSWPNNIYGHGEIDAKAGLEYIQKKYFNVTDVNKDGVTNALDINDVVSVVCGDDTYSAYADVNGDGTVDKQDVDAVMVVICNAE